jgi:hypothetical protein
MVIVRKNKRKRIEKTKGKDMLMVFKLIAGKYVSEQ